MMSKLLTALLIFVSCFLSAQIQILNFDSPSNMLSIDTTNPNNLWQVGPPNKTIFDSALSAPNVIVTDTASPYSINSNSSFTVGFTLNGNMPVIEFDHRFDTDSLKDGGFIEISNDNGASWLRLRDTLVLSASPSNYPFDWWAISSTVGFYGLTDFLPNNRIGFSGKSNGWQHAEIHFHCWAFKTYPTFLLRFTFVSDSIHNPKDGWMIDNLFINGTGICASLDENALTKVKAYPNPFSHKTRIDLEGHQITNGSYTIYNLQGQALKSENVFSPSSIEIGRNNLPAGAYTMVISEKNIPKLMTYLLVR